MQKNAALVSIISDFFFPLPCGFSEILDVSIVADKLLRCVEASRVLSNISAACLEASMMDGRFPI